MTFSIRPSDPSETDVLSHIAIASKRHWGYPDAWMERWGNALRITPDYIGGHDVTCRVAMVDDRPVGFYALLHRGKLSVLDHLWVLPEFIGKGIGRALFEDAVQQARNAGAEVMELEADPNATGFYRHMGARHVRDTMGDFGRTLPVFQLVLDPAAATSSHF
jgi:GNAT superfamily N-acetyltransferase